MADVKVSLKEIDDAIFEGIEDNRELRRAYDDLVDDVHATWVGFSPTPGKNRYATGDYIEHIKKVKLSKWYRMHVRNYLKRHKGMPIGQVYNDSLHAHFVEYGTGPDDPGSHSPWGPDTPTDPQYVMRKTYLRFLT